MRDIYYIVRNSMGEVWVNSKETQKEIHQVLQTYLNMPGAEVISATQSGNVHGIFRTWVISVLRPET